MARLPVRDNFDLQNQKVTNLANPTDAQDAASRQWVLDQIPSSTGTGNYRGSWVSTNSYSRGDVVYYETDTFFYITRAAIAANTLINPSLSTNWRRIDATGGEDTGSFRGRWAQNTAYTQGQVLFTDASGLFTETDVQNKIYRVENNFTSASVFDTTNLAIIGERNTQYGFASGTTGGTFVVTPTDTLTPQIVDTGAADREVPIRLWNSGITYAVGDQVMHDGGSNVNSIYICRVAHTSTVASSSQPQNNQDQWRLVRSGIVSVQGPDDIEPAPLTGNSTLRFREGAGINITRAADSTDFTIDATGGDHIPFYSSTALYEIGDIVAYEQIVDSITAGSPPDDATELLTFIGNSGTAVPEGGRTAEEPFISTNTGIERFSRDWMISASNITPFQDVLQYATGAVVIHGGALFRARQNILRSNNTTPLSPPSDGDNWTNIGIVDSAVTANSGNPQLVVSRQAWDRLNRTVIGYPLITSGENQGEVNQSGDIGFINPQAQSDLPEQMRTLIDVPAAIADWAETDNTTEIPADKIPAIIARDSELINRVEFNNSRIEIFYASNTGTTPNLFASLAGVGEPIEYSFTTIADRNAGLQASGVQLTAYPANRIITALVTSDSTTTPGTTTTTQWALLVPPASGVVTENSDWSEIGQRGIQISSVLGGSYLPYLDASGDPTADEAFSGTPNPNAVGGIDCRVQLGTEDTTEGIDATTANSLIDARAVRYDATQSLSASQQQQARTNIDVFSEGEVTTLINNISTLDQVHHDAFAYVQDDTFSNGLIDNSQNDFYNILGLFLDFTGSITAIVGTQYFLTNDGNTPSASNLPVLTLEVLGQTDLSGQTRVQFRVVDGYAWLSQYLSREEGTETQRVNDVSGVAAFQSWYTRTAVTTLLPLVRQPDGNYEFVAPSDISGAFNLNTVADVSNTIAPQEGQVLRRRSGFWVNEDFPDVTGGTGSYPDTGGIAIENIGSVTASTASFYWPTGGSAVFGENTGWSYTAGTGSTGSTRAVAGALFNQTGSTRQLNSTVIDFDINFTAVDGNTEISPTFRAEIVDGIAGTSRGTFNLGETTPTINSEGQHTIQITMPSTANIQDQELIQFVMSDSDVPQTIEIRAVRVSFTADSFARTGTTGGATTFTELTDTPDNYTGSTAGNVVQVNSTQNGLIFNQLKELASDFNENQFYERGDMVTVLGADGNYQYWTLNVADLNGRTTPITAANQPGGSANAWQQFQSGGASGFSAEMFGSESLTASVFRWPTRTPGNTSGLNGWTYTPGTGSIASPVSTAAGNRHTAVLAGGQFTNATGSAQDVRRVDIDIRVTQLPTDGDSQPRVSIYYSPTSSSPSNDVELPLTGDLAINTLGHHTISITGASTLSVANGGVLSMLAVEGTEADRPISFDILGVRFSSTTDAYLNPVYPTLANEYTVITNQSNDITTLTASTQVRFDVIKLTPGTGGTVDTSWFVIDGFTPGTGGTVTRVDGGSSLVLQPGLNSYFVTFGNSAQTIADNPPISSVEFRVDGRSGSAIDAVYGIAGAELPTTPTFTSVTTNSIIFPDANANGTIRFNNTTNRFEFVIGTTVVASLGTDGFRAIDNINDPTPAS